MAVNLVVDTSVWSLVLRRPQVQVDNPFVQAFRRHLTAEDGLFLIGNILQELLDGLRSGSQFQRLTKSMAPFPLLAHNRTTYIEAARLRRAFRAKGIPAGPVDCLIAAVCIEQGFPLLTADRDFLRISQDSELVVLPPLNETR
ncbi:MAG: PIN domain-containing protein [Nitrospira sp.]|nr:PIN domain-containing protein [Nitrospira sp.]MDE0485383.1 PIN domain-containing protein [Nitrospira sp.]